MMLVILIGSFFLLLILGMPIALVMGTSASLAFLAEGISPVVMAQRTFTSTNSFALMAIPLFMLAGNIMERTGITEDIIDFSDKCVGHIRGGLAHTTCLSGMILAAMCGSNNASASAIGSMMIPGLRKEGYDDGFSASLVAAAGNLGPIIPPSIIMIIYASATNLPITALFMAGAIPGILMGIGFMFYSALHAKKLGMEPKPRAKLKVVLKSFVGAFFALLTPIIILVSIIGGFCTATESGAIAVLYSIIYGFVRRRLTLKGLVDSLYQSAISTLAPMIVICFASAFAYLLTYANFGTIMVGFITSLTTNQYLVMLLLIVLIMIIGMFVEVTAALLMMIPMFTQVIASLGFDPLYFAIIVIITFCIGAITPPVGITLYVSCGIAKIPLSQAIKPIWPFVFIMLGVAILIVFVPGVATLLPSLLGL
ncbi:MAG: TRAP transporter large permease [Clostridia bacterium]|nr:TRAP transporter large permease [Clostridia bacterium]